MEIQYPTRCKILNAAGQVHPTFGELATPEISTPYIGDEGLAERDEENGVKITLDNGATLYGYECWWKPI